MKSTILGTFAGAFLMLAVLAVLEHRSTVFAQQYQAPGQAAGGDRLIALSESTPNGQLLTVIDPRQRAICVYRVDSATGKIALRSVRNIHYDLQMSEFNGEAPLPREIRLLLEQR